MPILQLLNFFPCHNNKKSGERENNVREEGKDSR